MAKKQFLDQGGLRILWEIIKDEIKDYSITKEDLPTDEQIAAAYHLTKDGEAVGEPINIPRAQVFRKADVKVWAEGGPTIPDIHEGDKYIDIEWVNGDHSYILVQALVDIYTAGHGISIEDKVVSVVNKVNTEIERGVGKSQFLNDDTVDEIGLKFVGDNSFNSFIGVGANTNTTLGAQIYDINTQNNTGTRLDVTDAGIYYTRGNETDASKRDIKDNELAVQKDVDARVEKVIAPGEDEVSTIFNTEAGAGIKYRHSDGSIVSINTTSSGAGDMMGQIKAEINDIQGYGSKINLYHDNFYYLNESNAQPGANPRDPKFEIATVGQVDERVKSVVEDPATGNVSKVNNGTAGGGIEYDFNNKSTAFVGVDGKSTTGNIVSLYAVNDEKVGANLAGNKEGFYYWKGSTDTVPSADNELLVKSNLNAEVERATGEEAKKLDKMTHGATPLENVQIEFANNAGSLAKMEYTDNSKDQQAVVLVQPFDSDTPGVLLKAKESNTEVNLAANKDGFYYVKGALNSNAFPATAELVTKGDIESLGSALRFLGRGEVTALFPTVEEAINEVVRIYNLHHDKKAPLNGDVVLIHDETVNALGEHNTEYIYANQKWDSFGNPDIYETKTAAAQKYDELNAAIAAEADRAEAIEETKVDKETNSSLGKATISNGSDAVELKFKDTNTTLESFVGVKEANSDNIAVQIHADKDVDGKKVGAKLDVTNTGIFYSVTDKEPADRLLPANEVATKGNIASEKARAEEIEATKVDKQVTWDDAGKSMTIENSRLGTKLEYVNSFADPTDVATIKVQPFAAGNNLAIQLAASKTSAVNDINSTKAARIDGCADKFYYVKDNGSDLSGNEIAVIQNVTDERVRAEAEEAKKVAIEAVSGNDKVTFANTTGKLGSIKHENPNGNTASIEVQAPATDGTAINIKAQSAISRARIQGRTDGFYYVKGVQANPTADDEIATIATVKKIGTALHYIGQTALGVAEDYLAALNRVVTNYTLAHPGYELHEGAVAILVKDGSHIEYIYADSTWQVFGDESLYETKVDAAAKYAELDTKIEAGSTKSTEIENALNQEIADARAAEATKVDKEVDASNGKLSIFNTADGSGTKVTFTDGSESSISVKPNGPTGNNIILQAAAASRVAKVVGKDSGFYYKKDNTTIGDTDEIVIKKDLEAKVESEITGTNGTAKIINTEVGVGVKYEFEDNSSAFVGVCDGGNLPNTNSYSATTDTDVVMYAVDAARNGARLTGRQDGFYYWLGGAKEPTADDRIITEKQLAEETARAEAVEATKVTAKYTAATGKAEFINDSDGTGAKFTHDDETISFVGVGDSSEGILASIGAAKVEGTILTGTKLDVTKSGIYYTKGSQSAGERVLPKNEIITKEVLAEETTRAEAAEATKVDKQTTSGTAQFDVGVKNNAVKLAYTNNVTTGINAGVTVQPISTTNDAGLLLNVTRETDTVRLEGHADGFYYVKGVGSARPENEVLTKADVNLEAKEDKANKVIDISTTSTDTQYPSAKAVYTITEEIRAIAEGKAATYVVSAAAVPAFASDAEQIEISGTFVDIRGVTHEVSDLKAGDNIYVTEEQFPDRWVSIAGAVAKLNRLETTSPAVKDVRVNGVSVVNPDTGIANVTLSALQLIDDVTSKKYSLAVHNGELVLKEVE